MQRSHDVPSKTIQEVVHARPSSRGESFSRDKTKHTTGGGTWRLHAQEHDVSYSRECMVVWDVDNVFPQTVGFLQRVIDVVVGQLCVDKAVDVVLAGNIYTTQRLCEISGLKPEDMVDLIQTTGRGTDPSIRVEFVETPKRKNAVDRALEQRMIQFSEMVPGGHVYCISNDGDFANTLGYCSYKGSHVTSIGTIKGTKNANWRSKRHNKKLIEASDDAWRLEMDIQSDTVRLSRYEYDSSES